MIALRVSCLRAPAWRVWCDLRIRFGCMVWVIVVVWGG